MRLDGGGDIDIADDLSVDDQKRFRLEKVLRALSRAPAVPSISGSSTVYVMLTPNSLPSPSASSYGLGLVMEVDDEILETKSRDVLRDITHQRFPEEGDRRFRAVNG